jgi:RHS repeat-associated protein
MSGDTTQYVLDLAATLPVVISDTEAVYLYGLDIIAQQQAERLYYFHDGLGSVRQMLDSTGEVETNYAYDPFGVPVVAGDASNPYQFTGEAWDEEVELLYLRARYYQPEVGRFITKDPWVGDAWEPGTLNRYAYVQNNPVNSTDPRGLQEGDYSSYESYKQSRQLVSDWFHQEGPVRLILGPEEPLTQDVRYSPAVQLFKRLWGIGEYEVPWHWGGHTIDIRWGPELEVRMAYGVYLYLKAHWKLGVCSRPWASVPVASQMDPVDATLGSLEDISVRRAPGDRVLFEVFNKMGLASGSRIPGTERSVFRDVERSEAEWGGSVYMVFYWWESASDYPDLKEGPQSDIMTRAWRLRGWEVEP